VIQLASDNVLVIKTGLASKLSESNPNTTKQNASN
jgi:hypothetical protein